MPFRIPKVPSPQINDPSPDIATSLQRDPDRMTITNMVTLEAIEAHFNPTELHEELGANYGRLAVQGLSHLPLQYQNTDNHKFEFDMAFHVYQRGKNRLAEMKDKRLFLLSLMYPVRGASDVTTGAPATILFVWPNIASMRAKITTMKFDHKRFGPDGQSYAYTAKLSLEEMRDVRLYADEVRQLGTERSSLSSST